MLLAEKKDGTKNIVRGYSITLHQTNAFPQTTTLPLAEVFDFGHELADILELFIDRRKSNIGNRIKRL